MPTKSNLRGLGALEAPDALGLRLPKGFTAKLLATTGEPVGPNGYIWHRSPDGGAVFPMDDGGWVYTSNSEVLGKLGGVSALRFDSSGNLVDAYRILEDTSNNCAGGPSPWGTWFTCEETSRGEVYECDPTGKEKGILHAVFGKFRHEAVAFDTTHGTIYLTEDEEDGGFYRFRPATQPPTGNAKWDLSAGTLEVAQVVGGGETGELKWHSVPEPSPEMGATNTKEQVMEMTKFNGGEGLWFQNDKIYFSTKGDNRVWLLDTKTQNLSILYDAKGDPSKPLTGVDNLLATVEGEVVVAEDGGNMEIVVVGPDGAGIPLLQVTGQDESEITGPAFDPSGTRLYFSSQRGKGAQTGITYEVTGPFFVPA